MKTLAHISFAFAVIVVGLQAQTSSQVVERGLNYNVFQRTTLENGTNRISRYTELATGLNYTNSSGQFVASSERITIRPDGSASAIQGQHRVQFPADIYNGVIHVTTPEGHNLCSRPLAVAYSDGSNTVFIATLTNSIGVLTASNQITYRNCFAGIDADLVCDYERSGFESSLVIRSRPPAPDQFGLDPSWVTLQLVTEFFDTEDPKQILGASDDWYGLQDKTLKFGELTMTRGKAFAFQNSATNRALQLAATSFPVYKTWVHFDERKFLVEEVPFAYVAADLNALPVSANIKPSRPTTSFQQPLPVTHYFAYPLGHPVRPSTNCILIAETDVKTKPGLVLDYIEINTSQSDLTFHSGQTYLIDGAVNLSGVTTIENGAVLKFNDDGCLTPDQDKLISFPEDPRNPAILTSVDDNSVGAAIGTGSPVTGSATYVSFPDNCSLTQCTIRNVRVFYAGLAFLDDFEDGNIPLYVVSDSQFVHCTSVFYSYSPVFSCENVLFSDCQYIIGDVSDLLFQGTQVTADQCDSVIVDYGANGGTVNLTNCILSDVERIICLPPGNSDYLYSVYPWLWAQVTWQNGLAANGILHENIVYSNSCFYIPSSSGLYEATPAASYYLASSSSYRDAGTTSMDPDLLAKIQNMTTYAPQDGGYPDNDGTPDLGYHYPGSGYIKNGLVAYWKLDDGSGSTAVDLINGNNLTLHGSPTWGTGYLTFDGSSQYGDAGNPTALNITGNITICAWVNAVSFPGTGQYQVPVEKGYDGTYEGYFMRYSTGSLLEDGSYSRIGSPYQFGNSVANPNLTGKWYFLTSVYDGSHWYLYINGLFWDEISDPGPLSSSAPLYVGAASISGSPERFFHGSVHDVGIYNRALSAGEIKQNFLNTKLDPDPYPDLLYYEMTPSEAEQVGQTQIILSDYSQNASHAGYGHTDGTQLWEWNTDNVGSITLNDALHFNGNNTILIVTNSNTDFNFTTEPFTVNLWVDPDSRGDDYLIQNDGVTNGWYIKLGGYVVYFGSASGSSPSYIYGSSAPNRDWTMVTCVWNGTSAFIYNNGKKVSTSGTFNTPGSSSIPLIIGVDATRDSLHGYLDGELWLTQIWGSALSDADIASLYFQQIGNVPWP